MGLRWGDAGDLGADRRLVGTLSLYENAAVLTHQSTVRKDRRFHQGPQAFYLLLNPLLAIELPALEVFMERLSRVGKHF